MTERWAADRAGCILAGGNFRTADELNAEVILLANREGWDDGSGITGVAADVTGWLDDEDVSDALTDAAEDATDWLNEHVAPTGHYFTFEEDFYLWPVEEGDD